MSNSVAIPLLDWRGPREIIHGEQPHQTGAYFKIGKIGFTALLDSGNLMEPVLSLDTADMVGLPHYPFKTFDGHHNPGHSIALELVGLPPINTTMYVDFYQGPEWYQNVVPLELFTTKYSVDIMPGYAVFSKRAKGNVPYVLPPKALLRGLPPKPPDMGPLEPGDLRPLGPDTGVAPIFRFEVDGVGFRALLDTGGDPRAEGFLTKGTAKKIGLAAGKFPKGPFLPPESVTSWGHPSMVGAQSYIVPITVKNVGTFNCVTVISPLPETAVATNVISIAPFLRQNWQVIFHEDSADFIPPGGWGWWE